MDVPMIESVSLRMDYFKPCWTSWFKGYFTLLLLNSLLGHTGATHKSNGVSTRNSYNPYGKEPAKWTSKYIQNAIESMTVINETGEWPGVNAYYKQYVDQYPSYVKGAKFVRLTSAPSGLNEYGKEYIGVCVNLQLLDPSDNSSFLGLYTCPLPFEPPQHTFCCGNDHAEYCCEPVESLLSIIAGPLIVGPLALIILVCGIYTSTCGKKGDPQDDELAIDSKVRAQLTSVNYQATGGQSVAGSENQTSTTSLGSEADKGYESGQVTDSKMGLCNPLMVEAETNQEYQTQTDTV